MPHGDGKIKYNDGSYFEGNFVYGKKEGFGYKMNKDGSIFKGMYVDNAPHGQGIYVWTNGDIYKGSWKMGFMDGEGQLISKDGSYYNGSWAKGDRNGFGESLSIKDGIGYKGEWKNNLYHGNGVLIDRNKKLKWSGEFVQGKFQGKGRELVQMLSNDTSLCDNSTPRIHISQFGSNEENSLNIVNFNMRPLLDVDAHKLRSESLPRPSVRTTSKSTSPRQQTPLNTVFSQIAKYDNNQIEIASDKIPIQKKRLSQFVKEISVIKEEEPMTIVEQAHSPPIKKERVKKVKRIEFSPLPPPKPQEQMTQILTLTPEKTTPIKQDPKRLSQITPQKIKVSPDPPKHLTKQEISIPEKLELIKEESRSSLGRTNNFTVAKQEVLPKLRQETSTRDIYFPDVTDHKTFQSYFIYNVITPNLFQQLKKQYQPSRQQVNSLSGTRSKSALKKKVKTKSSLQTFDYSLPIIEQNKSFSHVLDSSQAMLDNLLANRGKGRILTKIKQFNSRIQQQVHRKNTLSYI